MCCTSLKGIGYFKYSLSVYSWSDVFTFILVRARSILCKAQTRTHDKLTMIVFLLNAYALVQLYTVLRGNLPGVCWPLVANALAPVWGQAISSHYPDLIVTTLRHATIIHIVYHVTVHSSWKGHVHKVLSKQRKIHKSFTSCSELLYGPVIIVILRVFH